MCHSLRLWCSLLVRLAYLSALATLVPLALLAALVALILLATLAPLWALMALVALIRLVTLSPQTVLAPPPAHDRLCDLDDLPHLCIKSVAMVIC